MFSIIAWNCNFKSGHIVDTFRAIKYSYDIIIYIFCILFRFSQMNFHRKSNATFVSQHMIPAHEQHLLFLCLKQAHELI